MNNLYDILNIKKIDIEKAIQESIQETKEELNNLSDERTCLIYTSYLYQNLKKRNILCYIVDTMDDLAKEYQHRFIVIPKDEENNYVLDLTIGQFGSDYRFEMIKSKGYQLLNGDEYVLYIDYVSSGKEKRRI